VNIEDSAASVTLNAHMDSGAVVASEVMNVPANAKVVELAENLFTQNISAATSIGYSSDREVVGFQLNGSTGGMMLDALPALAGVQPPGTCSPEVTAFQPFPEAPAETVLSPVISATISSACGVDIDQSSIVMTLNGDPVPHTVSGGGSVVTATFIPDYDLQSDWNHDVTVHAEDVNGEAVDFEWTFWQPFYY